MWRKIKDYFTNKENKMYFLSVYCNIFFLFILGIFIFRDNTNALAGYLIGIPTGCIVSEIIKIDEYLNNKK